MPQMGITSIRTESASLNFSKGGSTSIYVDQAAVNASDNIDGYSWSRPKKTIAGAIAVLQPWMEIWIKPGIYQENVVITEPNVVIHGIVQAGLDRAEIAPISGVPVQCTVGYVELEGLSIISTNDNAIELTGPGHKIHDCFIEVDSDGTAQCSAILLNDCDKFLVHDCNFSGRYAEDTIGVRVDGTLNASVDCCVRDNYFHGFGTVATPGQCINLNNAQRCLVIRNTFDSSYIGVNCEVIANALHTIVGNQFYANASVDICDLNPDQQASGIHIQNNFYGYTGWYSDPNHDGIADVAVQCYYNYDYAPLAYPHYQGPSFVPRQVF